MKKIKELKEQLIKKDIKIQALTNHTNIQNQLINLYENEIIELNKELYKKELLIKQLFNQLDNEPQNIVIIARLNEE